MKREQTTSQTSAMFRKAAAVIAAGVLSASCLGMPVAMAAEITPSAGEQTGSGATDITIQLKGGSLEVGGAGSEGNPDGNSDGYGDNIAFSVPTSINFVADSVGRLTGPSNAEIQNHSKFAIHGSSLEVSPADGWNIVADAVVASQGNSIDFQIGPSADMLDASAYLTKGAVSSPSAWNMVAGSGAVSLSTAGDINNVTANISAKTKVATLRWYVAPGAVS